MHRLARIGLVLAVAALAARWPAGAAPADAVVGNGTASSCTEDAVAGAMAAGGLVTFNCSGSLTIGFLTPITLSTTVTLEGADLITLSGGQVTRLFIVPAGFSLNLRHITLEQGKVNGSGGGAIVNHGRLTLQGSTIQSSQVDANALGGAIFTDGPLTITDSTLFDNLAGSGGAIYARAAAARVTIAGSRFVSNTANNNINFGFGGALWLDTPAQLTLTGGEWLSNSARYGGAIYVAAGAVLTASGELTLSGNTATVDGGAIYTEAGSAASLERLSLIGNHATAGKGGGVTSRGSLLVADSLFRDNLANYGGGLAAGLGLTETVTSGLAVSIQRSLFQSNTAFAQGGGVNLTNSGAVITITDTVFDGNHAGTGGGLARDESHLTIERSAFTHNDAIGGGALFVTYDFHAGAGGYVTVRDTTFATNTSIAMGGAALNQDKLQLISVTLKGNSSGLYNNNSVEIDGRLRGAVLQNTGANCDGKAPLDDGRNFATDTTCAFGTSQQGNALDPMLGPLAVDLNNPAAYFLPLPGSPLIDTGPNNCSLLDQRGIPRVGACDIGAVEFGGLLARLWLPLVRR